MTLKYEFNPDEKKDTDQPADDPVAEVSNIERYDEGGHQRFIIFQFNNGDQSTQYYSWLNKITMSAEKKEIIIVFGQDEFHIKGERLDTLFEMLSMQLIKKIVPVDKRYAALNDEGAPLVMEVVLKTPQLTP